MTIALAAVVAALALSALAMLQRRVVFAVAFGTPCKMWLDIKSGPTYLTHDRRLGPFTVSIGWEMRKLPTTGTGRVSRQWTEGPDD